MAARLHKCESCKAQNLPPVLTNRARRIGGRKAFLCPAHYGAVATLRADVAGTVDRSAAMGARTVGARQAAEGAVYSLGTQQATARAEQEAAFRTYSAALAFGEITADPTLLHRMRAAALRQAVGTDADNVYDSMLDAFIQRYHQRMWQGQTPDVSALMRHVCAVNSNVRTQNGHLRLDAPTSHGTVGNLLADTLSDDNTDDVPAPGWRVAGTLSVSACDLYALASDRLRTHPDDVDAAATVLRLQAFSGPQTHPTRDGVGSTAQVTKARPVAGIAVKINRIR